MLADQQRQDDLARYEYLQRHNLLRIVERPGLRRMTATWLVRLAVRLDARIAEVVMPSAPEPARMRGTPKHA